MTDEKVTARRLTRLLKTEKLDDAERTRAIRCLRRLQQPLRLTIFGTQTAHAVSLLNLLAGKALVPPSVPHAHVQVVHSVTPYIDAQVGNGSVEKFETDRFQDAFSPSLQRARIGADIPLLKKVAFLVLSNANSVALCQDASLLSAADIVLWAGETLNDPLMNVWSQIPDRIRDHSHLVLSETMGDTSWLTIADEFVSVLKVDPALAQSAKARGDKNGFQAAGGMAIVRQIKKEIEGLRKSALDAAQVVLIRHDADHEIGAVPDVEWPRAMLLESKTAAEDATVLSEQFEPEPKLAAPEPIVPKTPNASEEIPVSQVQRKSRPAPQEEEVTRRADVSVRRVSRAIQSRNPGLSQEVVELAREKSRKKTVETEPDPDRRATPWSLGL